MVRMIENHRIVKPYFGGWRHKVTGVTYFNGVTQTPPRPPRVTWDNWCSREVQTAKIRDGQTQSLLDCATQMWRADCCIPNASDKYIITKPYETFEQMQLRLDVDRKARIIQRNYRVYRLWKGVKESASKYRHIIEKCNEHEKRKIFARRRKIQRLIIRKIHPQTREDFDMLYSLVDQWRSDCLKHLRSTYFRAGQVTENNFLLEKTVRMFNDINKHQQILSEKSKEKRHARFLTLNCQPIRWIGKNGKPIEMVTTKIQEARKYKHVYDALRDDTLSIEERSDVLMALKESLKVHKCLGAIELEKLLDQEITFLLRGLKQLSQEFLRKRVAHYYLRFLSIFNACSCTLPCKCISEIKALEELRETMQEKTMLCRTCMKMVAYHKFSAHSGLRKITRCNSCVWLCQRNTKQISYDPYIFILNCLRIEEKRRNSLSKWPIIMQAQDIYHLVNTIWHGCSIVSKNKDIYRLRMVRFRSIEEWSPWNSILLTEDEAEVHCRIQDLSTIYTGNVMHQITLRHLLAKNYFKYIRNRVI